MSISGKEFYRDAFGRVRTSLPLTLFDSKHLADKLPLIYDESITDTSGNAASTYVAADAAVQMSVGTDDIIIRQSFIRPQYQPGEGQYALFTGVLGASGSGVISRIGLFDGSHGLFFELNEGTLYVVKRTGGVDTKVAQSQWNMDKLNRGNSAIDPSKAQIFVIDFEWLAVGRVRFGFKMGPELVYCHQIQHANNVTGAYIQKPNLPVRYEIRSTDAASSMKHICASIKSEGGQKNGGVTGYVSNGDTHIDAAAAGTFYALVGIRLKSDYLYHTALMEGISAVATTNDPFEWAVFRNPTVAGTFTYSGISNYAIQAAYGATENTVTGGTRVDGGYVEKAAATRFALDADTRNVLQLGVAIDGTPSELVLAASPLGPNADMHGGVIFREP